MFLQICPTVESIFGINVVKTYERCCWEVEEYFEPGNSYVDIRGEDTFEYYWSKLTEPAFEGDPDIGGTVLAPEDRYSEKD